MEQKQKRSQQAKQNKIVLVTPKLKATISRYKLAVLVRRMQSVNPKQALHIGIRKKSKMIKILNFWQQHTKNTPLKPRALPEEDGEIPSMGGHQKFLPVASLQQ